MFEFKVTTLSAEETLSIQIISFFAHIFEICEAVQIEQTLSSFSQIYPFFMDLVLSENYH